MSASSSSIADLYTVLRTDDTQFIAAAQRDATAMEEVATASEATSAKVKAGAAEQTVAAEKSAAATEVSTSRMGKGWKGLTSAIQEHGTKTTQVWSKVTDIGKVSAIALLAVGAASVHMASNFDATMELIHTQAGESQTAIRGLSQAVLDMAPTVGIGPEKLAEGLYHLESTGFRGKVALDILSASAKGAAIGMADLDTMSKGVAGIMSTAPKDITSASDAVALLNATVGAGDMRMQDLISALSTGVLPAFKSAGLGARDMAAALATLTDNGSNANEAATRLRMTVALMSAPSNKAAAALESVGISSSQLAEDMQKPNGLMVAVQDLHDHLQGLSKVKANQVLEHAFGGGRSSAAIMTLVQETDRLKSKYGDLGNSTTRAAKLQDAWTETQKTSKQQLHELGADLQKMGIQLGHQLLPPLMHMVNFLASHKSAMNAFFIVLAAGMAAFTLAVIANTIAMLANPTVWIVLAIVAAVALLIIGIYLLVKHWHTVWGAIKSAALAVWHWMVDAWHATLHGIESALTATGHWINGVAMSIWHPIVDAWHTSLKALKDAAHWVKTEVIDPIVRFVDTALVRPTKALLHGFSVAFQFVFGFLSVIVADWAHGWERVWHIVERAMSAAYHSTLLPIGRFINSNVIEPVKAGVHDLDVWWHRAWDAVSKATSSAYHGTILPIGRFIKQHVLDLIHDGVHWLEVGWHAAWNGITSAASWAYNSVILPIGRAIRTYAIQPVQDGIRTLGGWWSRVWDGVVGAVKSAWHWMQPIFDAISGAINTVMNGISSISNNPLSAGQSFAHMLGFADGGWVPGAPGQPQMAVVHGGEFVLSRDMLAGTANPGPLRAAPPSAASGGGGRPIIVQNVFMVDGRVVLKSVTTQAQRVKGRNTTTFLG